VKKNGYLEGWSKQMKDGSRAVILFNRGSAEHEVSVNWEDIGYPNHLQAAVRDLWEKKDLGRFTGSFSASVVSHGVVMVTVRP
jgi:alpha-galactosidase